MRGKLLRKVWFLQMEDVSSAGFFSLIFILYYQPPSCIALICSSEVDY